MPSEGALVLILVVVSVASTVWVLVDAAENSSQSAALWALVAFFGGLLGVLLYVLLGRDGGDDGGDGGRTRSEPERGTAKISHRCETCGEKYYAPGSDISACRNCGGIKVEELG